MKLSEKQSLFAEHVAHFILWLSEEGYMITFGETYRTPEQAEIYAKEGKGIINSLHCKRLAVDLNIFKSDGTYLTTVDDVRACGIYWESLHKYNRWGGNFKERPDSDHFEMQDL